MKGREGYKKVGGGVELIAVGDRAHHCNSDCASPFVPKCSKKQSTCSLERASDGRREGIAREGEVKSLGRRLETNPKQVFASQSVHSDGGTLHKQRELDGDVFGQRFKRILCEVHLKRHFEVRKKTKTRSVASSFFIIHYFFCIPYKLSISRGAN